MFNFINIKDQGCLQSFCANLKFLGLIRCFVLFLFLLKSNSPGCQETLYTFETQFNLDDINVLDITIESENWRSRLVKKDEFSSAKIKINGGPEISIEIARKGNSSFANTKKRDKIPMKLKGPDNFNFKLNNNYRDCTNGAREYLGYKLHRHYSGIAPYVAVTEVYVNGEFYGIFNAVEDLNKGFFDRRIGKVSHRVKSSSTTTGIRENQFISDLKWYGPGFDSYRGRYQFKSGDTQSFIKLLSSINQSPKEAHKILDIEQVCRFLAVENYIANKDGIIGVLFSHNYEMVRRTKDSLWQIIPWDLNLTFGALSYPNSEGHYPSLGNLASLQLTAGQKKNALIQLILDEYPNLYYYHYQKVLKEYSDNVLVSWAQNFKNILNKSRHLDSKLYPEEVVRTAFEKGHLTSDGYIPGLIPFIHARYQYISDIELLEQY